MNLNEYLKEARLGKYAIGHFNFATGDVLKAIVQGAKEAGAPAVMVGTSEGEVDFVGATEAVALVKAVREEFDFPVFLNADHFKSFEKCQMALDAGYDTVLIDGSKLSYEENVALVQRVKAYAGERPVEGEIGYLRGSSEVQEVVEISRDDYTQPQQAQDFVVRTGVDRLATVFGNIHGIVKKVKHIDATPTLGEVGAPTEASEEEHLDIEHFKSIVAVLPEMFFVLHGASGLADAEVAASIQAGIVNVHFNTELRVAYQQGIQHAMKEKPAETTPYKYLGPADEAVKQLVIQKVKMFMGK